MLGTVYIVGADFSPKLLSTKNPCHIARISCFSKVYTLIAGKKREIFVAELFSTLKYFEQTCLSMKTDFRMNKNCTEINL